MTQKELLSYAMAGINKRMDKVQEIIDKQIETTGEANPYTEAKLEKLWEHFYELLEMEKELEDKEKR